MLQFVLQLLPSRPRLRGGSRRLGRRLGRGQGRDGGRRAVDLGRRSINDAGTVARHASNIDDQQRSRLVRHVFIHTAHIIRLSSVRPLPQIQQVRG